MAKRESTRSAAAFAVYAAMGPYRSLAKLHRQLLNDWAAEGRVPTLRRLEEWSSKYGWVERAKQYDVERAEEKREWREREIEKINKDQLSYATEALMRARNQIDELIAAGKFGSQASVTLWKYAVDMQRIALGADKEEKEQQSTAPIQLIIELDNTPSIVPRPPTTVSGRVVEAESPKQLAAPLVPSVTVESDEAE